ncbi:MAG: transcription antitermination factor NusB [Hyphomicrobiales bacterium]
MAAGAKIAGQVDIGGRSAARFGAVQALYQMDLTRCDVADTLEQFATSRLGEALQDGQCGPADMTFLTELVKGVVREQCRLDPELNAHLAKGWTLARLDSTLRAILRSAAYEIVVRPDIPARVVINEYLDLTHAFFDSEEPGFVNGVLDRLAHDHRAEEFA